MLVELEWVSSKKKRCTFKKKCHNHKSSCAGALQPNSAHVFKLTVTVNRSARGNG